MNHMVYSSLFSADSGSSSTLAKDESCGTPPRMTGLASWRFTAVEGYEFIERQDARDVATPPAAG